MEVTTTKYYRFSDSVLDKDRPYSQETIIQPWFDSSLHHKTFRELESSSITGTKFSSRFDFTNSTNNIVRISNNVKSEKKTLEKLSSAIIPGLLVVTATQFIPFDSAEAIFSLPKFESESILNNHSLDKLISQIKEFASLQDNWDGYNAARLTAQAINDAIDLIKLIPHDLLPSRVGASNDGEISLIWEEGTLFADFGVLGDGKFCYFINRNNTKLYGDDLKISSHIPKEALNLLKK